MYICKLINELKLRGLIFQITDEKIIIKHILKNNIYLYCGFDPTADSLHVGHILPLLVLRLFQIYRHIPVVLIGTATSFIGDPSFKKKIRKTLPEFNRNKFEKNIYKQFSLFLNFNKKNNSAILLNNYSWFKKINIIDFLKNIGVYFSINTMINKESVKKRIYRKKQGILFSEFSYNLLQSYDFSYLYKKYNVILQIGGSDQWGNITSGIDLTRKLYKSKVFGMTIPLLIQSNGLKFGKTEKNTIWLDYKKTSPYKFFQFWLNIHDQDILKFLKFFSICSLLKIIKLEDKFFCGKIHPNYLKYILARSLTKLIHGKKKLISVERITNSLFGGNIKNMTIYDFKQLKQDGIFSLKLNKLFDLQTVLVLSSLSLSKTQSRKMILSNSISINQKKNIDLEYIFKPKDKLYNKYTLLSRGKKNHVLLIWNFK